MLREVEGATLPTIWLVGLVGYVGDEMKMKMEMKGRNGKPEELTKRGSAITGKGREVRGRAKERERSGMIAHSCLE